MPKSKSLDEYRDRRDFQKSPEPPPGATRVRRRPDVPTFVIHRHEARRLHYDLRLEMSGVLKSWAVPRGFSYDPTVKRLAVRTEDHPLEYESFEGVIPEGSYGAGTMTIWDRGGYRATGAIEDGKLEVVFRGRKLRGEWHLVRTNKEKDEWLLFKARDLYARGADEPAPFFDLAGAVESPPPDTIETMEIGRASTPFSDPAWVFEMKFEGRRVLGSKGSEGVRLIGSAGEDLTPLLPEITGELGRARAENLLVDGVLVALDESLRPSPERLERRLAGESGDAVTFYAFDLLHYEEWDIRSLPLTERKTVLASVLPRLDHVLFVDHVLGRGEDLVEATSGAGLAGVVAKEASSRYVSGPSPAWREIAAPGSGRDKGRNVMEALGSAASPPTPQGLKLTNLDKVYWPGDGITKGDLIAYYERVAEILLPYLYERPVHLRRFPDGIEAEPFYQKNAPEHIPEWIPTESIDSESRGEPIRYIICNDRPTLLYLVNLASIDLHPWLSRRGSLDSPDWAVLDLDPDGSDFHKVVKVARALGKVLRGIGLTPYLKTSGASGLHIYIPLRPGYTYEHSLKFCEGVARLVAHQHRDIATVERATNRRGGKVYIDFLQNRRGQTVVPPYVVRPVAGASVSAPLDWDELDGDLLPDRFTMDTMPERVDRLGDLFRGTLHNRQDLLPAIEALKTNYLGS